MKIVKRYEKITVSYPLRFLKNEGTLSKTLENAELKNLNNSMQGKLVRPSTYPLSLFQSQRNSYFQFGFTTDFSINHLLPLSPFFCNLPRLRDVVEHERAATPVTAGYGWQDIRRIERGAVQLKSQSALLDGAKTVGGHVLDFCIEFLFVFSPKN